MIKISPRIYTSPRFSHSIQGAGCSFTEYVILNPFGRNIANISVITHDQSITGADVTKDIYQTPFQTNGSNCSGWGYDVSDTNITLRHYSRAWGGPGTVDMSIVVQGY